MKPQKQIYFKFSMGDAYPADRQMNNAFIVDENKSGLDAVIEVDRKFYYSGNEGENPGSCDFQLYDLCPELSAKYITEDGKISEQFWSDMEENDDGVSELFESMGNMYGEYKTIDWAFEDRFDDINDFESGWDDDRENIYLIYQKSPTNDWKFVVALNNTSAKNAMIELLDDCDNIKESDRESAGYFVVDLPADISMDDLYAGYDEISEVAVSVIAEEAIKEHAGFFVMA